MSDSLEKIAQNNPQSNKKNNCNFPRDLAYLGIVALCAYIGYEFGACYGHPLRGAGIGATLAAFIGQEAIQEEGTI